MRRPPARRRAHYVMCVIAATLTGCQDASQATGPKGYTPPELNWAAPASGGASVSPVTTRYGDGTTYLWTQNYIYPVTTVIRIDVSGYVAQSSHYKLTVNGHLGPGGNAVIGVWYPGNYYLPYTVGGDPAAESQKLYISMGAGSQIGFVSRSGYGNDSRQGVLGTDGSTVTCGPPWTTDYCYQYSGGSSFTITPLASTLDVKLDSSIVAPGATVALTITASPAQVEGWNMGVLVDTIGWTADPVSSHGIPSETNATVACSFVSTTPLKCTRTIAGSGTFHVVAHVNGKRFTQDSHVAIRDRTLTLTGSPTSVHRPADKVTFTPRWSDGYPMDVRAWQWVPASGADANTEGCAPSESVCTTGVWTSGHMVVTVYREGTSYEATANVTVVPCATGDTLLDNPGIREAMWRSWAASGAETKTDPGDRHENVFGVYKDPGTGATLVVQVPTPDASACEAAPNGTLTVQAVLANGYKLIAIVHPHPVPYGSTWPANCGPNYAGSTYSEPKIPGFRQTGLGRGSSADWDASKTLQVPNIIVDFEQSTIIQGINAAFLPFGSPQVPFMITNSDSPDVRKEVPRNADSCPTH